MVTRANPSMLFNNFPMLQVITHTGEVQSQIGHVLTSQIFEKLNGMTQYIKCEAL